MLPSLFYLHSVGFAPTFGILLKLASCGNTIEWLVVCFWFLILALLILFGCFLVEVFLLIYF